MFFLKTETSDARNKFINSVMRMLNDYDFDGIDLAWQFPPTKVKKDRGVFSSIWHKVKKVTGYGKFKDEHEQEHRDGFRVMAHDLKNQLRSKNKALTVTVLPHINSSSEFIRNFDSKNFNDWYEINYDFFPFQFTTMPGRLSPTWRPFTYSPSTRPIPTVTPKKPTTRHQSTKATGVKRPTTLIHKRGK